MFCFVLQVSAQSQTMVSGNTECALLTGACKAEKHCCTQRVAEFPRRSTPLKRENGTQTYKIMVYEGKRKITGRPSRREFH